MSNNEINWEENEWFAKYHLQDCTKAAMERLVEKWVENEST